MKGYPTRLRTKEDYYNCLALVQAGELEAAGLLAALDSLEEQRYLTSAITSKQQDNKQVVIMYLNEAEAGATFICGNVNGTIKQVTNKQSADQQEEPSTTTLLLSAAVPADATEIKVFNSSVDVLANAGMTEDDIKAIKGVLKQYE